MLEAWKYSNEKGELSRDQLLSTIILLEKKGKNTEYLNNLRPITHTGSYSVFLLLKIQLCVTYTKFSLAFLSIPFMQIDLIVSSDLN